MKKLCLILTFVILSLVGYTQEVPDSTKYLTYNQVGTNTTFDCFTKTIIDYYPTKIVNTTISSYYLNHYILVPSIFKIDTLLITSCSVSINYNSASHYLNTDYKNTIYDSKITILKCISYMSDMYDSIIYKSDVELYELNNSNEPSLYLNIKYEDAYFDEDIDKQLTFNLSKIN